MRPYDGGVTATVPLWERERRWPLMRPFVYYLMENFAPPSLVAGARAVDFSAGLGDLSRYLVAGGAASVIATVPEASLDQASAVDGVEWRPGVLASRIRESFAPGSVDLFCARMVFQFPRWEDGRVDVDVMLDQIRDVLAPGGRIVIASHAFFPLQTYSSLATEKDSEALVAKLVSLATGAPRDVHEILTEEAQRLAGLAEMVQYLGLPPRDSSAGMTGYGLRVPLLVDSFIRSGLTLEAVDDAEPFTFPLGVWERFETAEAEVRRLGAEVMAIKRRWLLSPEAADPYTRPGAVRSMLREIRRQIPVVWVPIVRIVARKP